MVDYELDKLLVQVRRIEEHREKGAEEEIRKTYQKLLAELRHYMADEYTQYAEEDRLTYGILQQHGAYARFLEEVEQKINDISPETKRLIRSTVEQTYEVTYNGLIDCVKKAATGIELGSLKACTPDVMRRAVENPISKLTLNDRLEKHRKEIVYDIKQNISVGLMNGDRYSTMAKRISQSVEGNYKKAICIARTETHRVREAGSQDAAMSVDEVLKTGESGMRMSKTWRTTKDERVRPGTKAKGKARKYDHRKMDGITIPVDEEFILPSGAKTMAPGQSGVAGEDINCRCYVSHGLVKVEKTSEYLIRNHESAGNTANERLVANEAIASVPAKVQEKIHAGTIIDVGKVGASQYDYRRDILYVAKGANREEVVHEIGHMVESKMLDRKRVEELKLKFVQNVPPNAIISETYYDSSGQPKEIFLMKINGLVSEYQGRIYANDWSEIYDENWNVRTELIAEFISEPFREYVKNPQRLKNDFPEFYQLIKEAVE